MCYTFSNRFELCLQKTFYKWGLLVGTKPSLLIPLSLLFLLFALGSLTQQPFEDAQLSWAPVGSQAVLDDDKINGLEFEKLERADIIYKAKNGENVLTQDHFKRVIAFNDFLLDYNSQNLRKTDCKATPTGRCLYIGNPVEYF